MMDNTGDYIGCFITGWFVGVVMLIIAASIGGGESKEYKEYSKLRDYCKNNMQIITLNTDNKIMECK